MTNVCRDIPREDSLRSRERSRGMQTKLVADMHKNGDSDIHFLDGSMLLGSDLDECTVDGVHPISFFIF